MGLKTLRRRIKALEQSESATRAAGEEEILRVLHSLSQKDLELLITTAVTAGHGRALTENESAARQAYAAAWQQACRRLGVSVGRMPDAAESIDHAARRQVSDEDLRLQISGLRAKLQGGVPSASEAAAMQGYASIEEALYPRIGFGSRAEFESWYRS